MVEGYESVINKTGWGFCHYFVIGLCAICTLTEAAASMIVLIVIPVLACEQTFVKQDTVILNATCSLGMAFGSLIFGTLADTNGRKIQIPTTVITIFMSLVSLAFSQSFVTMVLCIFFLGVGLAGNNITLRVYLVELLPVDQRGRCLAILDLFWTIGYALALGLSWYMVPSILQMSKKEFRPSSWRILAAIGGVPCLIVASIMTLLPSSPRYLIYQRRPIEALTVLKQIYAINNSQHADNFNVNNLSGCVRPDDDSEISIDALDAMKKYLLKTWRRIGLIFSQEFRSNTFLFILGKLLLFPGLILMGLLSTHVFHLNYYTRQNCLQTSIDAVDVILNFLNKCQNENNNYFQLFIIFSSCYVIAEFLLVLGVDCLGRRLSLLISGLLGTTFAIATFISSCNDEKAGFILIFIFLLAYSVAHTTINIMLLENYPTSVRATMMGLSAFLPHLTTFFIKLFARVSSSMVRYIASGLLIGAVISAISIPDLTNFPMRE